MSGAPSSTTSAAGPVRLPASPSAATFDVTFRPGRAPKVAAPVTLRFEAVDVARAWNVGLTTERFDLSSDYTLAKKLGIAQPEANLMRRGLKIPKPELCIKIAKLLDKNPVELLLIAQSEAPAYHPAST